MKKWNKKWFIISTVVIFLPMIAGFLMWNRLPDRLITHWNAAGEADGSMGKFAAVQHAVLDGQRLAAAEEHAAQVAVGVHGGVVAGLVNVAAELCVDGAGMTVVTLVGVVGDHLAHDVQQVVLQELQVEGVDVVGALLNHDGAGGVVRNDSDSTVLDAGLLNDLHNIGGDVMEGGDPATGLQLDLFLNYFEIHFGFLLICKLKGLTN